MRQHVGEIIVETQSRRFADVTGHVRAFVRESGVREGLLTLFLRHTSASLVIQENADPDVRADLIDALDRLAPETAPWRHDAEGPDDMPAHVKSALTGVSCAIPVLSGAPALGTWQAIFVCEHRATGHRRRIAAHVAGL